MKTGNGALEARGRSRRALLVTAAVAGGAALIPAVASADSDPGTPILLGAKNGGLANPTTTRITNSAGAGPSVLHLLNGADAGTGLRAIADLAIDARGTVNIRGALRVTGSLRLGRATTVTMPANSASRVFRVPYFIEDSSQILATVNSAGSNAGVQSAVRLDDHRIEVRLTAAAASDTSIGLLVVEPSR